MLTIRSEQPEDVETIAEVIRLAFGRDDEAHLVENIRTAEGFDPALSLVALSLTAEQPDQLVGHVLFSPIQIKTSTGNVPAVALAPLAVRPGYQRKGIGSALVRDGLKSCQRDGHGIVVVLGHVKYYPRFGFAPAGANGIQAPFPVSDESFMILSLVPGALEGVNGVVRYPPAFEGV